MINLRSKAVVSRNVGSFELDGTCRGNATAVASTRISVEAVGIALLETRREASAVALPLPSAVQLETSHISIDDRFAAQIVYAAGRNAPAPKASGWLSAQHELRSSRKGPRPPIIRLLSFRFSFHFGLRSSFERVDGFHSAVALSVVQIFGIKFSTAICLRRRQKK